MTRTDKQARAASSAEQPARLDDDDEIPANEEQLALARKLAQFAGALIWRECPSRRCQRARTCKLMNGECLATQSDEPMTEDERSELMASFRRMLEERMTALAEARGEIWKPGGR
jgi:hypothetical protein